MSASPTAAPPDVEGSPWPEPPLWSPPVSAPFRWS